ncbi:MAG: FAD-binding protein [Thiolinea sp.]
MENGAAAIRWLLDCGVPFTREDDTDASSPLHLTREGGHSHRRVAHAADASGRAIETTLVEQVRQRGNIEVLEDHIAIDLITTRKLGMSTNRCVGAYVLNRSTHRVTTLQARFTVLATGGASKVYL